MKTVQEIMAENGSLANIERFQTMQKWEYKRKVEHAQEMAEAFYYWAKEHDKGVHLSVGGLDSITLHYFLESIGLPVTCVSCSSLEGKRQLVRLGPCAGLYRHRMGRRAGAGCADAH